MSASPSSRLAAIALALAVLAVACGDDGGEEVASTTTTSSPSSTTSTTSTVPAGPVAPLTGLSIDDEARLDDAAIVVKISNNDARSLEALVGIEQADVVIEERIEDRATRFAAVFHSQRPTVVGPVRSGRPADIDILANLGEPLLAYSGAHPSVLAMLNQFAAQDGVVLVVDDASGRDLQRDADYRRPDNLFGDLTAIFDKYGDEAGQAVPIFTFVSADRARPDTAVDGEGVTVEGRDTVAFVWDPDRGYVRVQDGEIHETREGIPLAVDNLVVMEVGYTPSSYDPRNVDAATVGSGPVAVMVGGERWTGRWERPAPEDPYRFVGDDGDEIPLDPGTTWLTLVPNATYEFAVDAESTALVLGGGQ